MYISVHVEQIGVNDPLTILRMHMGHHSSVRLFADCFERFCGPPRCMRFRVIRRDVLRWQRDGTIPPYVKALLR